MYFQNTNFHCLETRNGPKNFADFVLKIPMELVDIHQIHKLELHPRCVSFGKKLTLLMPLDRRDVAIFNNNRREVDVLLQTATCFFKWFEHLEVRQAEESGTVRLVPDNFDQYIPFIHLMVNVKKITLWLSRRWVNTRILRHIPNTATVEEIYMKHVGEVFRLHWSESFAVLNQRYVKSVTFLSGVNITSIQFYAEWNDKNNRNGQVFEKLKQVHILVDNQHLVDCLSVSTIQSLFPIVCTLEMSVENLNADLHLWEHLASLVNKFPCLKHFSLSGDCIPNFCECFNTIFDREKANIINQTVYNSVLKTFQFRCPMHVPAGLLQRLPSVKNVIVEEFPGRCQRYVSKSNDSEFVKRFFNNFPSVLTLSFVPIFTNDDSENLLRAPGTVKHFRSDMEQKQQLH